MLGLLYTGSRQTPRHVKHPQSPTIEFFGPLTYDFGNIQEKQLVQYDFEFRNAGREELVLTRIVPGCGCMQAIAENTTVAPGESSRIKVKYTGRPSAEQENVRILVETNDPSAKQFVLQLTGVVTNSLYSYPSSANFCVTPNTLPDASKEIVFRTQSGESVTIDQVTTSHPAITFRTTENTSHSILTVTIDGELPLGNHVEYIAVKCRNDSIEKTIVIPVYISALNPN